MPWKLLLNMGRIKPSPESIDLFMDTGEKLLQRAKGKLMSVIGEDLYYATMNPAQAALMLYGIPPATHRETIKLLDEVFEELGEQYKDRPGGYTRTIKLGPRKGDGAEMAILELVE